MIKIVHLMPGRMRLKLQVLKGRPEIATQLHSHLTEVAGISRVDTNTLTGSVLLLYEPRALRSPDFLDAFSSALGKLFPEHIAPGRLRFSIKRLKGRPELARRIEEHLAPIGGIEQVEIDPATGDCRLIYDSCVVTSPEFIDALAHPVAALVPQLNLRKIASRLGLRR